MEPVLMRWVVLALTPLLVQYLLTLIWKEKWQIMEYITMRLLYALYT